MRNEGVDDVFEAATRASMLMREGVGGGAAHHGRKSSFGQGSGQRFNDEGWEDKGKCCVIC